MTFVKENHCKYLNSRRELRSTEAHKRCSRIGQHRRSQRTCTRVGPTLTADHFDFPSGLWVVTAPIDQAVLLCYCARHVGCWAGPLAPKGEIISPSQWPAAAGLEAGKTTRTKRPSLPKFHEKKGAHLSLSFPAAGRRHRCCPCG